MDDAQAPSPTEGATMIDELRSSEVLSWMRFCEQVCAPVCFEHAHPEEKAAILDVMARVYDVVLPDELDRRRTCLLVLGRAIERTSAGKPLDGSSATSDVWSARLAEVADRVSAADIEAITAWMQREDAGVAPRAVDGGLGTALVHYMMAYVPAAFASPASPAAAPPSTPVDGYGPAVAPAPPPPPAPAVRPPSPAVSLPPVEAVAPLVMTFSDAEIVALLEERVVSIRDEARMASLANRAVAAAAQTWTARLLEGDRRVGYGDSLEHDVWVAGDIHGDLLAYALIRRAFDQVGRPDGAKLVFLGDVVDRGAHDVAVLASLLAWMESDGDRIGLIAGNHDLAVRWSTADQRFSSFVKPAEFADALNAPGPTWRRELGQAFCELVPCLPRALVFPGLLVSHGGFPLADTWESIDHRDALERPLCLKDFVNTRLADHSKKVPNRNNSFPQYGYKDFFGFVAVAQRIGLDVGQLVRGHDHVDNAQARWQRLPSYGNRVLTVNSLSYNQDVIQGTPPDPRWPTVAVWRHQTRTLLPIELHYSRELWDRYAEMRR